MALFSPGNRAFKAIANALNFRGTEAIVLIRDQVYPVFDAQASVESGVARQILLVRQDVAVGAATALITLDPHTAADWDEVYVNGVLKGDTGASIPQDLEDCWVTGVGVTVDTIAGFTHINLGRTQQSVALAEVFGDPLYFADTEVNTSFGTLARGAAFDPPFLKPLPWWFPPLSISQLKLGAQIVTSGANETTIVLECLVAPPGVFRRLYG